MKIARIITTILILLSVQPTNIFAQGSGNCVSGNCVNGYGKFVFDNGYIYEGDFVNNVLQGQGTLTLTNIGVYTGKFANGMRNGQGKFTFITNEIYEGGWVNDRKSGKGKEILANGGIYEGDLFDDNREGAGVFRFTDGSVYSGQFANGKRNGFGKLYTKSTNTTQEGIWKDDVIVINTSAIDSTGVKNGKLEDCRKSILSEGCRNYLLQSTASELLPQVKDSYISGGLTFVSNELTATFGGGTDRIYWVEFGRTNSNQYKPAENLKWGESLKKVKKKYGEPLQIKVGEKKIIHSYNNFQLVYNLDNILCWIAYARSKTESEVAAEQIFKREKLETERLARLEAERIANTPEAKEAKIKEFFIANRELDSRLDKYTAQINKLIERHNDYMVKYGDTIDGRIIKREASELCFEAAKLIDNFLFKYRDQLTPKLHKTLLESRKNLFAVVK